MESNLLDLPTLIKTVGYVGLFAMVFAESGLLIGLFLPGDSLIFTAGFLASQKLLNIIPLTILLFLAAVSGDSVGYAFGYRTGPRIFKREDSLLFDREHLRRSQQFYMKHGGKTIVLARFIPIVRTFAPILAGVGKMDYKLFLLFNVIGGALWSIGLSLAGYFLGQTIPNVDRYLLPIIALIILLSISPALIHIIKDPEQRHRIKKVLTSRTQQR
jgi:membrane-associated protein